MNEIRDWFLRSYSLEEIAWGETPIRAVDPELLRDCVRHLKERFAGYGETIKLPADSVIEVVVAQIIHATQNHWSS